MAPLSAEMHSNIYQPPRIRGHLVSVSFQPSLYTVFIASSFIMLLSPPRECFPGLFILHFYPRQSASSDHVCLYNNQLSNVGDERSSGIDCLCLQPGNYHFLPRINTDLGGQFRFRVLFANSTLYYPF